MFIVFSKALSVFTKINKISRDGLRICIMADALSMYISTESVRIKTNTYDCRGVLLPITSSDL